MHEVLEFKTTKVKQQTYSCYLNSILDIFNVYMSRHIFMNHELALKTSIDQHASKIFNLETTKLIILL